MHKTDPFVSSRFEVPIAGRLGEPLPRMARVRRTVDSIQRVGQRGASVSKPAARDGRGELEAIGGFDRETMVTESGDTRRGPRNRGKKGA